MTPREQARKAAAELAGRLKVARKLANMTQDQLAEAAAMSPVSLSKFETGVNLPSFENLVALACALQTSPNYLAGWDKAGGTGQGERKRAAINRLLLNAENLPTEWIEQLTEIAERVRNDKTNRQ